MENTMNIEEMTNSELAGVNIDTQEDKEIETVRDAFEFMNEEFRKFGIPEFDLTSFKD